MLREQPLSKQKRIYFMFYTSVTEINNQTYIRGYNNSNKRFNYIRGYSGRKHPLKDENLKFMNDVNRLYITKKDFDENSYKIEEFLDDYKEKNQYFDYRINQECGKTNIYDNSVVEIVFPQNQTSNFKWAWSDINCSPVAEIQLWDDIGTDIKYISAMKMSKNWNPDFSLIRVAYIDIETECENGFVDVNNPQEKINVISLKINSDIYVWHIGQFESNDDHVISYAFTSELEMLEHFFNKFYELDLDIISGWNIRSFDIPCIVNRYINLNPNCLIHYKTKDEINPFSELSKLSPFRTIRKVEEEGRFGSHYQTYDFIGIEILDYMLIYMKYILSPRSSYKLDYICNIELGIGKLDYSEYGTLHNLYQKNFQKFVEYNIVDSTLIQQLEDKLGLIQLVCELGYYSGISFKDVKSPVKTWDAIIYNQLRIENKVTNPVASFEAASYPGAFVKPTKAGIFDWVVSFDVNSLYPSIIRQVNLSPETITNQKYLGFRNLSTDPNDEYKLEGLIYQKDNLEWLKEQNLSLSANGNLFKRDKQGILPYLTERLYAERATAKKEMKKWKQKVQDIETQFEKEFGESIEKYVS